MSKQNIVFIHLSGVSVQSTDHEHVADHPSHLLGSKNPQVWKLE